MMTLRLLLDTNAFIPLEPVRPTDFEERSLVSADLARMAMRLGGHLLLHPESVREIEGDHDQERREVRQMRIRAYELLESPPPISLVEDALGAADPRSHDWVDHHLLAAVHGNAVHYLITEDDRIHRKAQLLGLEEAVMRIAPAVDYLRTLLNEPGKPPPEVRVEFIHRLNRADPIFLSLRSDYPGFDSWLDKAAREQRRGWTINTPDGLAGVCLWKDGDDEFGLGGKVMKVSTFKVSDRHRGNRFGDLLLKALFYHLSTHSYDHVWLTVFPRHEQLMALLEEFGFDVQEGRRTKAGEWVMAKRLSPDSATAEDPFEFHRRFGPPALDLLRAPVFVVPIRPTYHRVLFPDYETQAVGDRQALLSLPQRPFGNALRKAYLSRSGVRALPRGTTILFYRSEDVRGVTALGVVEATLRSEDPAIIAQFTNLRTVYSFGQITDLAFNGCLAIRFRQDRLLPDKIAFADLKAAGVLSAPPQSITRVHDKEAIRWLNQRINASR